MRSIRKHAGRCLAATILVLAILPAPPAAAQTTRSGSKRGGSGPAQPVPPEVLADFLQAVKQTPQYQWYLPLGFDVMKDRVARWQEEFGYRLDPEPDRYYQGVSTSNPLLVSVVLPNDRSMTLTRYFLEQEWQLQLLVDVLGPSGGRTAYTLKEPQLDDLARRVLFAVEIIDPLATPVDRFTAQNEPLSTLFNRLCAMGQASCSYRQDLADKMRITLDVRGKTVLECLTVLARTAGGQALYVGKYGEPTPVEKVDPNSRVRAEDLRKKQAEAAATQPATGEPDPAGLLRKAIQARVESMQKDRPVIILQLPVAGE